MLLIQSCSGQGFKTRETCPLEENLSLAQGIILLRKDTENNAYSWQLLDLSTGKTQAYTLLDQPKGEIPESISLSPDGRKIAYLARRPQKAYIFTSGPHVMYAPVENFNLTHLVSTNEWFIDDAWPRSLEYWTYRLTPTGEEDSLPHLDILKPPKNIMSEWQVRLGIWEQPGLATLAVDGSAFHFFDDIGCCPDGWLDQNTVLLTQFAMSNFLNRYSWQLLESNQTILVNWETGEAIMSGDSLPNRDVFVDWSPAYSPSLRFVVYPSIIGQHSSIAVFDREKNQVMARIELTGKVYQRPLWLDNRHFAFIMENQTPRSQLFIADTDGKTRKIFEGDIVAGQAPILVQRNRTHSLLALWVSRNEQESLLFFDMSRHLIFDFCITTDFRNFDLLGASWMLDYGKFIISLPVAKGTEIRIVDVIGGRSKTFFLPEKVKVFGEISIP